MLFRVALVCLLSWGLLACETSDETPPIDASGGQTDLDAIIDLEASEPDTGTEDVTPPDIPETIDCEPGAGCFGEPCNSAEDCFSGVCTDHLGDQVCSKTCDEACPPGWNCTLVTRGGSDPVQVCTSQAGLLCQPCNNNDDCVHDTGQAPCVSFGEETGAFCGSPCDDDT
ncbi:MAG: hypothetical protein VX938_04905, partial [Myxococcota bacterium]|nr:hypothetical protein [Myxococcota bacterium]